MRTVHLAEVRLTARYVVMEGSLIVGEPTATGAFPPTPGGYPALGSAVALQLAEAEAQLAAREAAHHVDGADELHV